MPSEENPLEYLELEEADEEAFEELHRKIQEYADAEDQEAILAPDSRFAARDFLLARLKLEDEIEYLKSDYIPMLEKRYVDPVKDKIGKHKSSIDFINVALRQFLDNAEEKNVVFPDLGTVSRYDPPVKMEYENERELTRTLEEIDSPFIVRKSSIDKKAVLDYWKKNGEAPFEGVESVISTPTIRVIRAKKAKEE